MSLIHRFVLVAITQREARVWNMGIDPGSTPIVVIPPDPDRPHRHNRQGQHHHGHSRDGNSEVYFGEVATTLKGAAEILILGNATGTSNAMANFVSFLDRGESELAHKVVAALEVNLPAMTEGEILAYGRHCYSQHVHPTPHP